MQSILSRMPDAEATPEFDEATRKWIEAKAPPRREQSAEDKARGAEVIQAAGAKGADATLADALAPQLALATDDVVEKRVPRTLTDKLLVPSFSTLDTRAGYWQDRRRAWLSLGLRGETLSQALPREEDRQGREQDVPKRALNTSADDHEQFGAGAAKEFAGRKQGLIYQHDAPGSDPGFYSRKRVVENELGRELTTAEFKRDYYDRDEALKNGSSSVATGTSVFDPVLCEIAYRWFSGEGARVLDPFAGGVVRGAVAGVLGRRYLGVELRPEQIADNRLQADALFDGESNFGREAAKPRWVEGDATNLEALKVSEPVDLVFTCPPYADLEVYSDNPRDLSTLLYPDFREGLKKAMVQSTAWLADNRFAVWVVGEAREGTSGCSYGIIHDTVGAARAAGLGLYNEGILLNSVGSAALRSQRILRSRKLTRVHQHVLVFVKGDWKKAAEACGEAELQL